MSAWVSDGLIVQQLGLEGKEGKNGAVGPRLNLHRTSMFWLAVLGLGFYQENMTSLAYWRKNIGSFRTPAPESRD